MNAGRNSSTLARSIALTRHEWPRIFAVGACIIILHLIGWGTLILVVVPQNLSVGGHAFGLGIGVTAYTLGMRHAFDADHIAAIDNTTRKLITENSERPLTVGFWFSLGHSTVVFVLAVLLGSGFRALAGQVSDDTSTLHRVTGLFGTGISATFLFLIGLMNLFALAGIVSVLRASRRGEYREEELEHHLNSRGAINRLLGRVTKTVTKPWQMYPLGLLFGLGFDTATEVALLFLAVTATGSGIPWYAVLCLPILFAAGMTILDTIDGSFMNFAYGWAFSQPVRKIYYNIIVTALSITVAFLIGTIEVLSLVSTRFELSGPFWSWVNGIGLDTAGYLIAGLFAMTWVIAIAVWRFGGIEARWSPRSSNREDRPGS